MKKRELFRKLKESPTVSTRPLFMPILMHFAARFIGKTYGEFTSDYRVLVDANLRCMEAIGMDAVGLPVIGSSFGGTPELPAIQ